MTKKKKTFKDFSKDKVFNNPYSWKDIPNNPDTNSSKDELAKKMLYGGDKEKGSKPL